MTKKSFIKFLGLLLVVGLLFAAAPVGQAQAAAIVTTEAELRDALAGTETQIELGASFTLTATVEVNRTVSIDGKGFTITGPQAGTEPHQGHGLSVYADGVHISNLTITGSGRSNLNFYVATGGVVNNVVLSNAANAGMIVNGSVVTISNVTTSGNAWGGINVDQGSGVTEIPHLTVTNVTTHTSPTSGLTPAIWVDKGNEAWVSVPQNSYIKQTVPNTQMLAFFDIAEFTAAFPVHNVTKDTYFTTIQAAIDAANPGDTINVAAGTYHENLVINKSLNLIGAGRDVTIVQAVKGRYYNGGGSQSPIVSITGNAALLNLYPINITAPAGIANPMQGSLATFGPLPGEEGWDSVNGEVVYASDPLACSIPTNVSGKIALIDRGTCSFIVKADNAQKAGAIGVIIANTDDTLITMGSQPGYNITIPVAMVTKSNGTLLKAQTSTVTAQFQADPYGPGGVTISGFTFHGNVPTEAQSGWSTGGINGLSTQGIETDSSVSPYPARQNIHITDNKFVYAGSSVVLYNTVGFDISGNIMERASINYTGFGYKPHGGMIAHVSGGLNGTIGGNVGFNPEGTISVNASKVNVLGNTIAAPEVPLTNDFNIANYGIFVMSAAHVNIEGNNISGLNAGPKSGTTYGWPGEGIWVYSNASDVTITDNTLTNNVIGVHVEDVPAVGGPVLRGNKFIDNVYSILNQKGNIGSAVNTVDAKENYWESATGPNVYSVAEMGATTWAAFYDLLDNDPSPFPLFAVSDKVDFAPWCYDAACSFFVSEGPEGELVLDPTDLSGDDIQTAINNAPPGSTIVIPDGEYHQEGAFEISTPNLTIKLSDGTVIQNSSPCFVINASYTQIIAEPGAKCIPPDNSNGIDVAAGLTDIRVAGLEIYPDGTPSTGDGIHFAGTVTGTMLLDNKIHNMPGHGIFFGAQPAGEVDITGNLFQNNGGNGIEAGSFNVPAEYNSWGSYNGPAAGDGISTNVDADPWTHVDLYMVSSGTPWANQVVLNSNITFTIKAHLKNVNSADFVLTYPSNLTYVSSAASATFSSATLTHDGAAHTLHLIAYNQNDNISGDVELFTVIFKGTSLVKNAPLSFSLPASGGFGMAALAYSSNVYLQSAVDGSITVIDLPTISSTDIQGYYFVGEQRDFHVQVMNPATGGDFGNTINYNFEISGASTGDIALLQCNGVDVTLVQGTGKVTGTTGPFPMPANQSWDTPCTVKFNIAKDYTFTVSMVDTVPDPDLTLATYTNTAKVYAKPTISSSDIQGYYLSGEQREFSVVLTNPSTGGNFAHVYVNYTIAHADMDEIQSIEYSVDHTNWVVLGAPGSGTSYGEDGSGNIVGFFGQITGGGFPMAANSTQTTWFRVTFKTRGAPNNYPTSYAISMQLMDADFTPADRQLTSYNATANVYDKPTLTSDDIDGPYLAGVPQDFHITVTNPATGGTFTNSIYYVFTIANAEPGDIASLSCNGISVTLTDSGTDLTGRVGYGTAGFPMPAGQEWITTCNVKFKNAGSYSFTVNMVDNPTGVLANDRILVSMSKTATVNGNFAITGTFSMQGRVFRGGIPVTLTWTDPDWTYAASANTTDILGVNFQVTVTYGGDYLITTNQPRYLNLTAASAKSITVDGAKTLNALMLRGGNVNNDDEIGVTDASLIGAVYGTIGNPSEISADANFDGRVNILDLALVGGNYNLISKTAYEGWSPVTLP